VPATLHRSALNTPDGAAFAGKMVPGAAAADAPVLLADGRDGWLLHALGDGFNALVFDSDASLHGAAIDGVPLAIVHIARRGTAPAAGQLVDRDGLIAERYDLQPGSAVLLRPDQHVCARWREPSAEALRGALHRALAMH
jgi:3-(3-hydroxy-phenyl)propionate hydroxylase